MLGVVANHPRVVANQKIVLAAPHYVPHVGIRHARRVHRGVAKTCDRCTGMPSRAEPGRCTGGRAGGDPPRQPPPGPVLWIGSGMLATGALQLRPVHWSAKPDLSTTGAPTGAPGAIPRDSARRDQPFGLCIKSKEEPWTKF